VASRNIARQADAAALLFFPGFTEPVERALRGGFERTAPRVDSVVFVSL
jgi:hypothetical protein